MAAGAGAAQRGREVVGLAGIPHRAVRYLSCGNSVEEVQDAAQAPLHDSSGGKLPASSPATSRSGAGGADGRRETLLRSSPSYAALLLPPVSLRPLLSGFSL